MSDRKAEAVAIAAEQFGIINPRIYYPGCGGDKSLEAVGDVLYVDIGHYGRHIIQADARTYKVEQPIDIVAFFDSGNYLVEQTLANVELNAGGLVVWRSYNDVRPILKGPKLSRSALRGVIHYNEDQNPVYDESELDSYFRLTPIEEWKPSTLEDIKAAFEKRGVRMPHQPEEIWDLATDLELPIRPRFDRENFWEVFVFQP